MRLLDLDIPFPEIEGVSEKQEWYANSLRLIYVEKNEERFREINEMMQMEIDRRIQKDNWYEWKDHDVPGSMEDEYTNAEKACLFGVSAAGVIAVLKEEMGR